MPSASTSTLSSPSASRSSLSHSITVRSGIAAFSTGTRCDKRPARNHEPAGVLRQMARKAEQARHQLEELLHHRALGVEAGFRATPGQRLAPVPPRHRLRQPVDLRQIEPQRLADVAQRGARHDSRSRWRSAPRARGRICRRCTGSPPRAADARSRRRCRAARRARAR